jgi:hypothetical protein
MPSRLNLPESLGGMPVASDGRLTMTEVMEQASGTAFRLRPFVVGVAAVVAVALGGSVALAAAGGVSVDVSVGPLGSEADQDRDVPEMDVSSDAVTVQRDEVGPPDPLPAESVRPQTGGVPVDPFPDDPCRGPPPFAGQQPESEEARAAEAEEFRVQREACEAANTGSD